MSDKIELKPCAFCGTEGARMKIVGSPDGGDIVHYRLHCDGCGTDGPAANTASKAEAAWSMRPQAAFRFAACQVPDDESIQLPTSLVALLIGALAEYAGEAEFELIADANQQFASAVRTSPTAKHRDWVHLPAGPAYIGWMADEEKSRIHAERSNQSGKSAYMDHTCRKCSGTVFAQPDTVSVPRELLSEAESIIESYAEALKASHAPGGDWEGEEYANTEYEHESGVSAKLRALLAGGEA